MTERFALKSVRSLFKSALVKADDDVGFEVGKLFDC